LTEESSGISFFFFFALPEAVFLIRNNSPLVPLDYYPYAGFAKTVYPFILNFPVAVNTPNGGRDFPRLFSQAQQCGLERLVNLLFIVLRDTIYSARQSISVGQFV
jgi:hypothetical protein